MFDPKVLVRLRKKQRWSRSQTSYAVRTSEINVWRWETGRARPSPQSVIKLAAAFDVDPSVFNGSGK